MKTSCVLFSAVFQIAYVASMWLNVPIVRYFPQETAWRLGATAGAGPAMSWYGYVANALLGGLLVAAVVPSRAAARLPPILVWFTSVAALVSVVFHESHWFVR